MKKSKKDIIKKLPNVNLTELSKYFPKLKLDEYPELSYYNWEDCHKGSMGAGYLYISNFKLEKNKGRKC